MKKITILFLFALSFILTKSDAQSTTGPRTDRGKPVRLTPVPLNATPAEIQALLTRNHYLYFHPGTYNIGTLKINGWKDGLIWGAGRLSTVLNGSINIEGSKHLTVGNFSVTKSNAPQGDAIVAVTGKRQSQVDFLNILASGNKNGIAVQIQAPGKFIVQGCQLTANDIGLSIEHRQAEANVFGGNMQSNRIHIEQLQGHLDARAFGVQVNQGDADIVLHTPSPLGYHLVEAVRSEGNNSNAGRNEVLVKVPSTNAAVNVALRANTLGSMAHYADYNANGTLLLVENVNYLGAEDKRSTGVTVHSPGASNVISIGNKYGLSYDAAPGPFEVSPTTTVQSIGDLWMLPNTTDYSKSFNEPITTKTMQVAGKTVPQNVSFALSADSTSIRIPTFPLYKAATCPRIANLSELMLNVKDFGAVPNDGKDDGAAIKQALDAAEKGGAYEPLYFPAGKYELREPLFLDHLAGGGFWGEGTDRSVLVSTSGKGVLTSDGAGYAAFVDIGFENKPGAETKTTDFDWINQQSPDKKRGNTGAALQANMFYRNRFENGSIGIAVGNHKMGDGFMLIDCEFKNIRTAKGDGAAYASGNFNALTNPLVHCLFENADCAVLNNKGSFNFYGNRLRNIHTAALKFFTIVGDGFALINNEMDDSPVPFVTTGHSSAKAHLLLEEIRLKAPAATGIGINYTLGGSVLVQQSSFPNRTLTGGGGIGDNSLLVYQTTAAGVSVSGRAHRYVLSPAKKK